MFKIRDKELHWAVVNDETVILDAMGDSYLSVNDAGSALWPLLVSGASLDELRDCLLAAFDVDAGRAEADARAFVQMLQNEGLLDRG